MATKKAPVRARRRTAEAPPTSPSGNAEAPRFDASTRLNLYAARRYFTAQTQRDLLLRFKVSVYFKDPDTKALAGSPLDEAFTTPWEPGLRDGPTSARFAVVDFDATTGTLHAPAIWNPSDTEFQDTKGNALDHTNTDCFEFHQQNVWATVQNTLDYFEGGFALGRRISWAFEGGRLILVPHAGYGENAYYDRDSKSLQFYYFGDGDKSMIYTCLSSDIVNHEFAHAVLDGLRPALFESVRAETAAFHEFVGDLTAILMALKNAKIRAYVLKAGGGDLSRESLLSAIAGQFGRAVNGTPYLRSALNRHTMKSLEGNLEPHDLSEVLTGAMFDILRAILAALRKRSAKAGKKQSDAQLFWQAADRMQQLAIQPLDLLPPCGVTFADYARSVVRHHQVVDPVDDVGIRELMLSAFISRGILSESDREELAGAKAIFARKALTVFHPVDAIAASRGSAYRFLDDNRDDLLIPANADLSVADVVRAQKLTHEGLQIPDQIILQYTWREEVELTGKGFGRFAGQTTTMLCGGTIVLDQNGNWIHWARKPGAANLGNRRPEQIAEREEGQRRRQELLDTIESRVSQGMIGDSVGGQFGLFGRACPPFTYTSANDVVTFRVTPHLSVRPDGSDANMGALRWQISS